MLGAALPGAFRRGSQDGARKPATLRFECGVGLDGAGVEKSDSDRPGTLGFRGRVPIGLPFGFVARQRHARREWWLVDSGLGWVSCWRSGRRLRDPALAFRPSARNRLA